MSTPLLTAAMAVLDAYHEGAAIARVAGGERLFDAMSALERKVALERMANAAPKDSVNLDVISRAYGWTIDVNGQVCGLVAGDMGYEGTGIVIPPEHLLALLVKDPQRVEDALGYKAGYGIGVSDATGLLVGGARGLRRRGKITEADLLLEWSKKIREMFATEET